MTDTNNNSSVFHKVHTAQITSPVAREQAKQGLVTPSVTTKAVEAVGPSVLIPATQFEGVAEYSIPEHEPTSDPTPISKTAPDAPTTRDVVIEGLLSAPNKISAAQANLDVIERGYKQRLASLTISAFSAPLFPGKKDGEPNRPAGNDTEREAAIARVISTDVILITWVQDRESAVRKVQFERNSFEAAKLVAQLLVSESR